MTLVTEILNGLSDVNKPQEKFLAVLFSTMLVVQSAINFLSLSRYSNHSERTFRRQFRKEFDFAAFNQKTAEKAVCSAPEAVACDASFIKKSGKLTFGLDYFYNGTTQRAEKGLEVSLVALIDTQTNRSFALSAEQTPAMVDSTDKTVSETRIDFYLAHFRRAASYFPESVKYALVDGFYAKEKFVSGVCNEGYSVISRLRVDANLRFLYRGEQCKGRGRPRKYAGKVALSDLSRFELVKSCEQKAFLLYTDRVWAVSLKREIRVLVLVSRQQKARPQRVVLFSTDVELAAEDILRLYRSRFQIEFLFRDAKQSAGLETCQARDAKAIAFHWNASFAAVNLARAIEEENRKSEIKAFSMKSIKQRFFNKYLLELFIEKLDLDEKVIKNHPYYEKLRNYAVISA